MIRMSAGALAATPSWKVFDRSQRFVWCLIFLFLVSRIAQATPGAPKFPPEKMTFLDNGEVRVGMDLSLGGAVTFISGRDHPGNLINSADLGRQIQMSHYSGPWPFEPVGHKPNPAWAGLGWNPIQTGDCFLNPSKIVEHRNDGHELYLKCIPMLWPLENVPGDCLFETWTTLDGPVIHMRFRCTNQREDKTFYRPCPQELPAVYTISQLSRLMSYTGDQPFTGAALTHVTNNFHAPWPWTAFIGTERWAALVDADDWGLGVFKDDGGEFHGGVYGDGRSANPKDGSTAYVAPIHRENFDYNIIYEHRTDFMVGRLADIRARFNSVATRQPPVWRFAADRQHWRLLNATDQGFPFRGEWRIKMKETKPRLEGPTQCWRAEQAPELALEIRFSGRPAQGKVYWKRLGEAGFEETHSLTFSMASSTENQKCVLNLAASPEYRGLITGLALEPLLNPQPGAELAIKSIALVVAR